jgi:hypothetical protein
VYRIAISGLVALAAVFGGAAVPAVAMAHPTAAVRPTSAVRTVNAVAIRAARAAIEADGPSGEPLISCVLATACLGVEGSSSLSAGGGPSIPIRVARLTGSSWKGVGVALPKGTKSADLNGVACKGAKSCLVVGDYYTSTSQSAANHALALSYNGTSLKPTPAVPLPKGATDAVLTGVSCGTTSYCVAVGQAAGNTAAFGDSGSLTIVETWNGAKWALHIAPSTAGAAMVQLINVSCATSAFCALTGTVSSFSASSFSVKLYAESWNGKKLTAMKSAAAGGAGDVFEPLSASCATASNCAVTGVNVANASSNTPTLAALTEIWNGKTWQPAKVAWPKGTAQSLTLGVSCYGAHTCEVVGMDGASAAETAPFEAAAVSFKGTAGTLQAVPAPPKGYSTAFAGVSCLPWGSCLATGDTGKTTASTAALMTGVWNGKAWKLDPGF